MDTYRAPPSSQGYLVPKDMSLNNTEDVPDLTEQTARYGDTQYSCEQIYDMLCGDSSVRIQSQSKRGL